MINIPYLILGCLLFLILSPGMLLTLPPNPDSKKKFKGYLISGETNRIAILVHTFVFGLVFSLISYLFL